MWQFKKIAIHIGMQNSLQATKIFEAEYKDIYRSPYNFNSYFDNGEQTIDYMYTKLFIIFIPQLTLISF